MDDRARWNERYRAGHGSGEPNARLRQYRHLLRPWLALDLAGGAGRNAALLAGWTVILADISDEALAHAPGLCVLVKSPALPFRAESFDTILCTYFLDPQVDFAALLKPRGTLFFETYTTADAKYRPDFPSAYRLDPKQHSTLFRGLATILWEEHDDGTRVYGTFIGRKV
ncbi:MAG: class I SAM-dependent methyltransferase [Chloroflexi bacterium]|nr:class I SAM-dependent methyltransferase [Chloroflexota bacterium]